MEAHVRVVDHTNKRFEVNCLRWMAVISSAHNLLTCRDLERVAAFCNDGHESIEGEYDVSCLEMYHTNVFLACLTKVRR